MLEVIVIVQALLLVVLAIGLMMVIRQVGILSLRLGPAGSRTGGAGPEIGDVRDKDVERLRRLAGLPERRTVVLVAFVSPYCAACRILFPALRTVAREEADQLLVIAVARELTKHDRASMSEALGKRVSIVEDEDSFERWNINGTPYCVILDPTNKVAGKGLTNTVEHLTSLVNTIELGSPTLEDYVDSQLDKVTHDDDETSGTKV